MVPWSKLHYIAAGLPVPEDVFDADVNFCATNGLTPLMVAAQHNKPAVVLWLLRNGADLRPQTLLEGESALHLAARYGYKVLYHVLYQWCLSADLELRDNSGRTVLHTAVAADARSIVEVC